MKSFHIGTVVGVYLVSLILHYGLAEQSEQVIYDVLPCLSVDVSGYSENVGCNGHYRIDESYETHCSGRQMWSRFDGLTIGSNYNTTAFLYYLQDGYNGWVIAKTSCLSWGNFMAMIQTDSQEPFDLSERWMEYSNINHTYQVNDDVKVTCTSRATNYCSSTPCLNGAQCINDVLGFNCECDDGHVGNLCETERAVGRPKFSVKFAIGAGTLFGVFVGVVLFSFIVYRRRRQLQQRTDAFKERSIHIGGTNDLNKYKRLEEMS